VSARSALQRGYVLHARPYRETSLLVDCLTIENGRISLVAKGARTGKAAQRRLLQPFAPLLISYLGQGELHTLTAVEEAGTGRRLIGERLACGLYLNELLMYLLPRGEAVEELFAFYNRALDALASDEAVSPLLRRFELNLLEAMGVAPNWAVEISSGDAIVAGQSYALTSDGPVDPAALSRDAGLVDGESLQALAQGSPESPHVLAQTKRILRYFIHLHLGGRELKSRELLRGPVALGTGTKENL